MHKILLIEKSLQKFNKLNEYFKLYPCQKEEQAIKLIDKYNIKLVLIIFENNTNYKYLIDKLKNKFGVFIIAVLGKNLKESIKEKILSSNVDDFLYEPIDYLELDFVIRKLQVDYKKDLHIDNIIIDSDEHLIKNDEISINLPPKEFQLLHLLFAYPERLFLKDEILDVIWWDKPDSDENTIRTHINRLRRKIKVFPILEIETIQCIGYKGIIKDKQF